MARAAARALAKACPSKATELLFAPHAGVISYLRKAGDWVDAGEPVLK